MAQIATTKEQSDKLISLGLNVNTADMYWVTTCELKLYVKTNDVDRLGYTPAWSLSALLNLIPNQNDNERNYCYIEVYVGYYTVSYCNNWDGRIFSTKSNKCLLDAAFEMVCYLLENKLI